MREEEVKLDCIVVGDRVRSVLSERTILALMDSINDIGLINPIMIARPRMVPHLVAGAHRLEAARRLGWASIRCTVSKADSDELKLAEIDENLIREDLSPAEKAIHIDARKEIYERLHPETRHGAIGNGREKSRQNGNSTKADNWNPDDITEAEDEESVVADRFTKDTSKKTGKPERTIQRAAKRGKKITRKRLTKIVGTSLDKGDELDALGQLSPEKQDEIVDRAAAGEKTSAKTELKKEKRQEKEEALAQVTTEISERIGHQLYNVILADPPWRFEPYSRESGMDRAADNHYPTATLDEIKDLDVEGATAPDSVLFLWATAPMLPEAMDVMRAWGFTYKSHQIWNKDRIGTGFWFRNKHELLLVGTRGSIPAPAMGTQWASVIDAPVGQHSEKPDDCYRMIEELFPTVPKLEMFARKRRDGWEYWGNETTKFSQEAA